MKEIHLKPALDGNGKPICNSKGEPVYERTEKPGIQTPPGEVSSMKVGIPKVLEFELATGKPKGQ
jgi:hypothetical protein